MSGPEPYWSDAQIALHLGDCVEVLAGMAAASVDAVVTDPPYGLEFMGKDWDRFSGAVTDRDFKGFVLSQQRTRNVKCPDCSKWAYDHPGRLCECGGVRRAQGSAFQLWCEQWAAECLRVLKPGGHLLAFGGTRTWHRLTCAIEDAGFEIRDSVADLTGYDAPGLMWVYSQGFPKSHNVRKAAGEDVCSCQEATEHILRPLLDTDVSPSLPVGPGEGSVLFSGLPEPGPSALRYPAAKRGLAGRTQPSMEGGSDPQAPEGQLHRGPVHSLPAGAPANGAGGRLHHGAPSRDGSVGRSDADADRSGEPQGPQSLEQRPVELGAISDERGPQAGRGWALCGRCGKPDIPRGLGTALKPGWEPIVVARKPLAGTVAQNVLAHGTGALNVDGCRVEPTGESRPRVAEASQQTRYTDAGGTDFAALPGVRGGDPAGRWPANVLLGPEAAEELDRQSGVLTSGANPTRRGSDKFRDAYGDFAGQTECTPHRGVDSGGASRFFPVFRYEAKAGAAERPRLPDGTAHPTVKPVPLKRWLVRLVTPPGGLVCDPFAGSGTTGEACIVEGFRCVLIEKDPASVELIRTRLRKDIQPDIFGGVAS